jgi:predicted GNAT family acetyltransferase
MTLLRDCPTENDYSAMVVGVCTLDSFKGKGLASQCLNMLCFDLLNEGKSLCLFYDNLNAGRIYKRLRFEDMEMWTMTIRNNEG